MFISFGVHLIQSTSNTKRKPSLTRELGKKKYKVSYRGGRKSYLDGYELIAEEENQIFEPVEEVEPVEVVVFEEEDDF